jgi:DNA gyrase subunit A
MRIVYEIKNNAITNVVLNKLYKYTALQSSFSVNNICLVKGRPQLLNLKQLIGYFVEHRHEVIVRRTKYDLQKAKDRAHILEGLIIASDNIDEVIQIIRGSKSPDAARENLMTRFDLSEIQARAIVEMRLRHLTGLEQDKLRAEYKEVMALIEDLEFILANESKRFEIIKEELIAIKEKYGDPRNSEINLAGGDFRIEDIIPDNEVVVTISHLGYIKRTELSEYRTQSRGGVGSKGSATRNEDFLEHLFVATNHNWLLIFTEKGKCFWMRVFEIPEGNKTAKGRAIQNLINIERDDRVMAYINVKDIKDEAYAKSNFIVMCTKNGVIKKTTLDAYSRPRTNGINAINVREDDQLLEAKLTNGSNEILMAINSGRCIRFNESAVRPMGRNATGVKGITLPSKKDQVIGMICIEDPAKETVLVVSKNGYGKRTYLNDPDDGEAVYRITNRGGKGVKTLNITEKTGDLIALKSVNDDNDLMIINISGITIRLEVSKMRVMGRATQGVKLINLKGKDTIAAVAKVPANNEEDENIMGDTTDPGNDNEENNNSESDSE